MRHRDLFRIPAKTSHILFKQYNNTNNRNAATISYSEQLTEQLTALKFNGAMQPSCWKMLKDLPSLIIKHTVLSRKHLTPELAIRVIDRTCPLWRATEDGSPFRDPFWAFYWPGGQAMARYILDNSIMRDRRVLDVGCGCGAGSIAAVKMKAKRVLANDIDPCATVASEINAKSNDVTIETTTENLIGTKCEEFDTILIGDMFYDEEFANMLFEWLLKLNEGGKMVLLGDPGRHGLTQKRKKHLTMLAKYVLPKESCIENHGFTETTVWTLNK